MLDNYTQTNTNQVLLPFYFMFDFMFVSCWFRVLVCSLEVRARFRFGFVSVFDWCSFHDRSRVVQVVRIPVVESQGYLDPVDNKDGRFFVSGEKRP